MADMNHPVPAGDGQQLPVQAGAGQPLATVRGRNPVAQRRAVVRRGAHLGQVDAPRQLATAGKR